jgi:hypothetical protein
MSTSDGQPLTRRQLRELRDTGQNPIITSDDLAAAERESAARVAEDDAEREAAQQAEAEEAAAEPAEDTAPEPEPEPEPAAEARPLTRRELRERLRTGSVPTITGELVAEEPGAPQQPAEQGAPAEALIEVDAAVEDGSTVEATIVTDETATQQPDDGAEEDASAAEPILRPAADDDSGGDRPSESSDGDENALTVRPGFGAHLAEGESAPEEEKVTRPLAPSFDELITRPQETGGSSSAPSALILKENPDAGAFNAPITSTGELLITSSHKLPEGFGSSGAAKGTTDGREIDAVLIDGEIPLASSPTPIAASEAVSTSKSPGEVIRPPAPEKNHRLVLTLGITAGVLCIAVVGAVVIAYATGVLG